MTTVDAQAFERFQVDLRGVMEVLARHLYSSRDVFVRELLQNGVDAVSARRRLAPGHAGRVVFECDKKAGVLTVHDNGIGLREDEIRSYLSRVGGSIKRNEDVEADRSSLIGQFGIGMLSCFMVADEIVVLTRSESDDGPGYEWVGRSDGTFRIRPLTREIEVGTRVVLKIAEGASNYLESWYIERLVRRFGEMLPLSVCISTGRYENEISADKPVWSFEIRSEDDARDAARAAFGWGEAGRYAAAFPIRDPACGLEGMGFLRRDGAGDRDRMHRVYIKNMFVTDTAGSLVPSWGSFCRCVINSDQLRPTASRESVYEDDCFERTSGAIAKSLIEFLHGLADGDPAMLRAVLSDHDLDFRRVALENDRFFRAIIDLLEFETSDGWVTLGDFRREQETICVVGTGEQFRLVAPLARLRGQVVFNGGYTHHAELLHKAAELLPEMGWMSVSVQDLLGELQEAGDEAQRALVPIGDWLEGDGFDTKLRLVRFEPASVAGLYVEGMDESLSRSIDSAMDVADELWSSVLGEMRGGLRADELGSTLCLNAANESVRLLLAAGPGELSGSFVRMIYVQSLIEAQQPLSAEQSRMFSDSLGRVLRSRGVS